MKPIRLFAALDPSTLVFDEANRTIRNVIVSTGDLNRNNWRVNATSLDLSAYNLNPILMWNHDGYGGDVDPDIVIGVTSVRVDGDKLLADLTFEDAHLNPLAEKVYRKMLAKTIRATSIGLDILKSHLETTPDGSGAHLVIDQAQLLEISVVIIPANPAATVQAAIDTLRPEWAKEDSMNKVLAALLAALCLPESADEKAAVGALETLQASQKVLKDATGKDSPAEAAGVIAAWKAGAEQAQAALAKLADIEKAAVESKRASLVQAGMKEGKILPPQEAWAKSLPIETLQAYLDNTPTAAHIPPKVEQPKTVAAGAAKPWSEMTIMEKHRLANDDPETFATLKASAEAKG